LAAACADTGGAASRREDMLASAGFVPKKADTAARMASMKALPPYQFVTRNQNGRTTYLYADPTVCGCIYVGDQNAYNQYRRQMAARQTVTDDQVRTIFEHRTAAWRRGPSVGAAARVYVRTPMG